METYTIKPKPPFSITPHIKKFCPEKLPIPCIVEGKSCRRMILVKKELVPYQVNFVSEGENPKLVLKVFTENSKTASEVLEKVKKIYRVYFNYKKFLEKCKIDKRIYEIAKKYYGLRPPRVLNAYEALVDSIIEQNISFRLALRIKSNFVKEFGEKEVIDGKEFYSFPLAEKISKLEAIEIKRKAKTSLAKARAIVEVAKMSENLPKEKEIEKDPESFFELITKIKGIGKWTAQISIAKVSKGFSIGPYGDLAVKRGFRKVFGIEKEEEIEKFSKKLKEYTGLLLYFMAFEGHP